MDGRRLRRWFLCGGLLVTAVGCNRNSTYQDNLPKPGQPVGAVAPSGGSGGMISKMMPKVGGTSTPPSPGVPGMPTEVATAKPRKPGTGMTPDDEVAFADVHVAAALGDPPSANRDELLDLARMRYQKAMKEDPKHKGAILGMARLYSRLGDREKAVEMYKKYLHHYPKDTEVLHEVAMAHAQWKDWDGAVAWCDAALKVDPENRTYRKTMGFCQARGGKWDEAFSTLIKVMPEPQARYSIARVMEHLNHQDAARQQLQLAAQADPNFAPAREMLAEMDGLLPPGEQPVVPGQPDPNPIRQVEYQK